MRDAMIAGTNLNIFNNHSDRVHMANLAQTVNVLQAVILTKGEKMIKTPTYHVMEMYNVHFDGTLLPLHLKTNNYQLNDEKLPAISVSASRNEDGVVHISLVNIDASTSQDLEIDVRGMNVSKVSGRILKSEKLQDHNSFDMPDKIKPSTYTGAKLTNNKLMMSIPPFSVVVLTLK
jgi:alpha-L-arabinofuranosidase